MGGGEGGGEIRRGFGGEECTRPGNDMRRAGRGQASVRLQSTRGRTSKAKPRMHARTRGAEVLWGVRGPFALWNSTLLPLFSPHPLPCLRAHARGPFFVTTQLLCCRDAVRAKGGAEKVGANEGEIGERVHGAWRDQRQTLAARRPLASLRSVSPRAMVHAKRTTHQRGASQFAARTHCTPPPPAPFCFASRDRRRLLVEEKRLTARATSAARAPAAPRTAKERSGSSARAEEREGSAEEGEEGVGAQENASLGPVLGPEGGKSAREGKAPQEAAEGNVERGEEGSGTPRATSGSEARGVARDAVREGEESEGGGREEDERSGRAGGAKAGTVGQNLARAGAGKGVRSRAPRAATTKGCGASAGGGRQGAKRAKASRERFGMPSGRREKLPGRSAWRRARKKRGRRRKKKVMCERRGAHDAETTAGPRGSGWVGEREVERGAARASSAPRQRESWRGRAEAASRKALLGRRRVQRVNGIAVEGMERERAEREVERRWGRGWGR